ncbi:Carbonic anhydrase [Klebsiella africana]|uniref:Carbonic anhydrase n=1 Tax=Klebsiella africana TaxID=2489010 RepID=A0A8B6IXZ5_9ENTR|nr:hypothetical protein SB5857_04756 [Klebsiella africana]
MTTLKPLLARNRCWVRQKYQYDPYYFEKWIDGQRPLSLHGCVYDLASGHLTTLVEHLSPQEHAP